MKKKLFCIVLSLAMVVTFMPAMALTAFADEPESNTCEVSGKGYPNISQVIVDKAKVSTKITVDLVADMVDNTIIIPENKQYVINLNNNTITGNITVGKGATLTITNNEAYGGTGEIKGTIINNSGKVTLEKAYYGGIQNNQTDAKKVPEVLVKDGIFATDAEFTNAGKMTIEKGSFTKPSFVNNGTMEIKSGKFAKVAKFENNKELTILDGTFDGATAPIQNNGKLTIKGGTFTNATAGVIINGGPVNELSDKFVTSAVLEIAGGKFEKNTAKNGAVIYNHGCPVTITGGTFKDNTATGSEDNGRGGVLFSYKPFKFSEPVPILVKDASMTNNYASQGGAIYVELLTNLKFAGAANVTGNYNKKEGTGKALNNVFVTPDGPKILSDALTGKVGVYLYANSKDDPYTNYFDGADLTKFVSDYSGLNFTQGKDKVSANNADINDAINALKILKECYKILNIDQNMAVADGAIADLVALQNNETVTEKQINDILDGAALVMFGNKIETIKDIIEGVAKGTLQLSAAAVMLTLQAADKAIQLKVEVTEEIAKDISTFAGNVVTGVAGVTGAAISAAGSLAEKTVAAINTAVKLAVQTAGDATIATANAIKELGLKAGEAFIKVLTDAYGLALEAGEVTKEAIGDTFDFTVKVLSGLGQAAANGINLVGEGTVKVIDTAVKLAEAAATAAAIQAIVGGVVNYAGQAFGALQARNVYNNAVKSISGLVGQASQNTKDLVQKGVQSTGLVLANGVQVGGRLLQLLAAGKISAAVAGTVANTAAYIGSFAKYPVYPVYHF